MPSKPIYDSQLDFVMEQGLVPVEEELWKLDANCVGLDVEMFFPDYRGAQYSNQMYALCNNCDVKQACISYATKYNMDGFWGGTTPKQRAKMKRNAAVSSTPTGVTVQ